MISSTRSRPSDFPGWEAESPSQLRLRISNLVREHCLFSCPGALQGIILTGSWARAEATIVAQNGRYSILSDAEFLLVFERSARLPHQEKLASLKHKLERTLKNNGIHCQLSFAAVHPEYFEKLPPHIFTYELRACGQIIWGDQNLLSLIPDFSPCEISSKDAWYLLCNRIIEQFQILSELTDRSTLPASAAYSTVKLYLDMSTSLLVFLGEYRPTYAERANQLAGLARLGSWNDLPFELAPFARDVQSCTSWKLSPTTAGVVADWHFWEQAMGYAQLLWQWELARMIGAIDRRSNPDLLKQWCRLQPVTGRLRGWLYVLRRDGWLRSRRQWLRWARQVRLGSPRHCVYRATQELLFRLPSLIQAGTVQPSAQASLTRAETYLPRLTRSSDSRRAGWHVLASEIAQNYNRYLVGTRS